MKTLRWLYFFIILAGGTGLALAPGDPTIQLTLSKSDFAAPVGGPDPTPGTLTIKNTGGGKLTWDITEEPPASWLSFSDVSSQPGSGLNPNGLVVIDVLIDVDGVAAGDYSCTVKVTSAGATNTPQTVVVNLHVGLEPRIDASPGSFSFSVPENGPNPVAQILTIKNTGGGTLSWTAASSHSWLKLNDTTGNLGPAASDPVSVSVDVTGLAANTYPGSITITAPGADSSPTVVGVTLVVRQKPAIGLQPTSLTFDTASGVTPASKSITVSNVGGGSLKWLVSSDVGWLTFTPIKGTLAASGSQIMTVAVNGTAPTLEGSYPATITVIDEVDNTIPQATAGVILNINAGPKIGVNPTTLSFTVAVDSGSSSPKAVSVTNVGSDVLNWSTAGGASWLKASPAGGALTALASEPLLLSVQPAGLAEGVYSTTLSIVDTAASNSPRTISVEMTVKPSSLPTSAPAGQCGLLGLEMIAVLLVLRTLTSRGGRS